MFSWIFQMTGSWNILGIILLLSLFRFQVVQAEITLPAFGNPTFISNGTDVTFPWTYNFGSASVVLVEWRFSKTGNPGSFEQLAVLPATGEPNILNDTFSGISVIRPATLVLKDVNLDHNGTYRISFTLFGRGVTSPQTSDILVIVLEQPIATTNCSRVTSLIEGESITCLCNSTNGNPPPTASWSIGNRVVGEGYLKTNLSLTSVGKEDNGTYICKVKSHNLTDEKSVHMNVAYRGEPQIGCFGKGVTSFCECKGIGGNPPSLAAWLKDGERITGPEYLRSELRQEDVVGRKQGIYTCEVENGNLKVGKSVTLSIPRILSIEATRQSNTVKITCKADAKPTPDYKIYRNGTRLSGDDGDATHDITGSVEQYKCVAGNIFGSVSETRNYTVPSNCDRDRGSGGTEWYLIMIALICGICVGMMFLYAMQRLHRKLKIKTRDSEAPETRVVPGTYCEEAGNVSTYEQLNLGRMEDGGQYQSLREHSRRPENSETKDEDPNAYQELNKVEKDVDNNYQSLNRL